MKKLFLFLTVAGLFSSCTKEGDALIPTPYTPPPPPPVLNYTWITQDVFFTDSAYQDSLVGRKFQTVPGATYSFTILNAPDYTFNVAAYTSLPLVQPVVQLSNSSAPFEIIFTATDTITYIVTESQFSNMPAIGFQAALHEHYHLSPEVNQGSWLNPITFGGNTFYTGTVTSSGTSYYLVNGLIPLTSYHYCLYSMTGDVDMRAHVDNTFSLQYTETLNHTDISAQPEVYTIPSDANGNAYISIHGGELNPVGTTFKLFLFQL